MNTTTVVLAAVIFTLVGTLVFAAIAPYLSDAQATVARPLKDCNRHSPDGQDGDPDGDGSNNEGGKGCGPNRAVVPG